MKSTSQKYLLFFIFSFLLLRSCELATPKLNNYLINFFIDEAKKNGITFSIAEYKNEKLFSINANKVKLTYNKVDYPIDNFIFEFRSLLWPNLLVKINHKNSLLTCTFKSNNLFDLILNKSANAYCESNNFNLNYFPQLLDNGVSGILDLSIETDLSHDSTKITSSGIIKITNGQINPNSYIKSSALKAPELYNIELYTKFSKNSEMIKIYDLGLPVFYIR